MLCWDDSSFRGCHRRRIVHCCWLRTSRSRMPNRASGCESLTRARRRRGATSAEVGPGWELRQRTMWTRSHTSTAARRRRKHVRCVRISGSQPRSTVAAPLQSAEPFAPVVCGGPPHALTSRGKGRAAGEREMHTPKTDAHSGTDAGNGGERTSGTRSGKRALAAGSACLSALAQAFNSFSSSTCSSSRDTKQTGDSY